MDLGSSAALFGGSLVMTALASAVLSKRLDQVGDWLGFSPGLGGLVTAMAADSPEIASAVTALSGGRHDLGVGVIFGSNIFNLAALLGLSAVVAGGVACRREALLLNAGAALAATAVIIAQRLYGLPPLGAGLMIAAVMLPYVAVLSLKPEQAAQLPLPGKASDWLAGAVQPGGEGPDPGTTAQRSPWADLTAIAPLLGMVVLASIGLVRAATSLAGTFGWSDVTTGALVIASLTGIPNLIAALRLALRGRGGAVVSEAFNSNSLNLIVGAYLPALFVASGAPSALARLSMWWLFAATAFTALLFLPRERLGRIVGLAVIACWLGFAATVLVR